jgi:hypothetical protein
MELDQYGALYPTGIIGPQPFEIIISLHHIGRLSNVIWLHILGRWQTIKAGRRN